LAAANPLALDNDVSLVLLLPYQERAKILENLTSSSGLMDWLFDHNIEDVVPVSEPLVDAGNRIDEQPWGWYWLSDQDRWLFAPLTKGQYQAGARAWMSASMTGAVIETGICCWGTVCLCWHTDDSDQSDYAIRHDVQDWDNLLLEVCSSLLDGLDPICPTCDEEDPSGWEVSVSASPIFSNSVVGDALTSVWQPCNFHLNKSVILEAADRLWRWDGDSWTTAAAGRGRRM
jgi:hypothetical protein